MGFGDFNGAPREFYVGVLVKFGEGFSRAPRKLYVDVLVTMIYLYDYSFEYTLSLRC